MSITDAEDVIAERNNPNLQAFRSTEVPAPLISLLGLTGGNVLLASAPTCERGSGVLLIKGLLVGDEKGERTDNDGEGLPEIGVGAAVGTRTPLGDNALLEGAEDGLAAGVKSDVGLRDGDKEGT